MTLFGGYDFENRAQELTYLTTVLIENEVHRDVHPCAVLEVGEYAAGVGGDHNSVEVRAWRPNSLTLFKHCISFDRIRVVSRTLGALRRSVNKRALRAPPFRGDLRTGQLHPGEMNRAVRGLYFIHG